jgi:hypothetical protein
MQKTITDIMVHSIVDFFGEIKQLVQIWLLVIELISELQTNLYLFYIQSGLCSFNDSISNIQKYK